MQLLYGKEVPSFLRGESPISFHPQKRSPPRGGAALQGRGQERSIWAGTKRDHVY